MANNISVYGKLTAAFLCVMLLAIACKKSNANSSDDDNEANGNTAVDNNLPQNTYSVNDKTTTAGFAVYSDLKSNGFSNCSGYPHTNCLYINFSGRVMPKVSGIYNIVYEIGNRDDAKEISMSYHNYYTDGMAKGIFSSYDSIVHISNIPAVTQKAIVTVENGKVNVKFTNLKLYGTNDPSTGAVYTPVSVSANVTLQ
jgi:hypothetical protein